MADLFEKCDVFMSRMRRSSGADFDKLDDVFHRVFPFNNSAPHIEFRGREMIQARVSSQCGSRLVTMSLITPFGMTA